ncbi:MAG: hypothetical protein KGL43_11115 [Burkholderiales bacterium]|nr:hypothetical protein [Burkholderiales bacterium]MDE2454132.1 hypothetical protein [Burkholderiales bacterium]
MNATPEDEALESAAWSGFVQRLGEQLALAWPAMPQRLGERYDAFVALAVERALERGFTRPAAIGRYVNLWFVWGPAFHDKPGFEWARGILAAPSTREWNIAHQLVQRSMVELERLPGTQVEPRALAASDAGVIDAFGELGPRGRLRRPVPTPLPRAACDLEAVELKLAGDAGLQDYRLVDGDWQRAVLAPPPALRIDAAHPVPDCVAVLSSQSGQGPRARLQARVRAAAVCDGDLHPALGFLGPHGGWKWIGHETRALGWPVATRDQTLPRAGPGAVIAEATSPEPQRIEIDCCGLRDEGDVLGSLKVPLSAWPAEQWWIEIQRAAPAAQALLPGPRPWARATTRCRVERDGAPQDAAPLREQFEQGLDAAIGVALHRLGAAWEALPGLTAAGFDAALGLLGGRMAATWGWHYGPGGLDGPALMRFIAAFEMDACVADLRWSGRLELAGTASRIHLELAGKSPLRSTLRRESAEPALDAVMKTAVARWRLPFTFAIEALAAERGALLQLAGPPAGALVGEAGLRPCTSGRSGWEWFAGLRLEAASVPLRVVDPLLGESRFELPIFPPTTLVDWSLG